MRPKTATAAGGGWGWFGACEDWNCHLFPLPGKSEGKIPIPSKNCQRWDGLKVLAHPYPTLLSMYNLLGVRILNGMVIRIFILSGGDDSKAEGAPTRTCRVGGRSSKQKSSEHGIN